MVELVVAVAVVVLAVVMRKRRKMMMIETTIFFVVFAVVRKMESTIVFDFDFDSCSWWTSHLWAVAPVELLIQSQRVIAVAS